MRLDKWKGYKCSKLDKDDMLENLLSQVRIGVLDEETDYFFVSSGDTMMLALMCGSEIEVYDLKIRRRGTL